MWMQTECFNGYKVRGWLEQREAGWRISTLLEGKDAPEKEYWVEDEVFYKPKDEIARSHTGWQEARFGALDVNVDPVEKNAVLTLIKKWDAQISLTSPDREESAALCLLANPIKKL